MLQNCSRSFSGEFSISFIGHSPRRTSGYCSRSSLRTFSRSSFEELSGFSFKSSSGDSISGSSADCLEVLSWVVPAVAWGFPFRNFSHDFLDFPQESAPEFCPDFFSGFPIKIVILLSGIPSGTFP